MILRCIASPCWAGSTRSPVTAFQPALNKAATGPDCERLLGVCGQQIADQQTLHPGNRDRQQPQRHGDRLLLRARLDRQPRGQLARADDDRSIT